MVTPKWYLRQENQDTPKRHQKGYLHSFHWSLIQGALACLVELKLCEPHLSYLECVFSLPCLKGRDVSPAPPLWSVSIGGTISHTFLLSKELCHRRSKANEYYCGLRTGGPCNEMKRNRSDDEADEGPDAKKNCVALAPGQLPANFLTKVFACLPSATLSKCSRV